MHTVLFLVFLVGFSFIQYSIFIRLSFMCMYVHVCVGVWVHVPGCNLNFVCYSFLFKLIVYTMLKINTTNITTTTNAAHNRRCVYKLLKTADFK